MSRRADPDRIFDAQRAGIRADRDRNEPETADRWLDAWGLEAAGRGLSRDEAYYWADG